jgi:hypothetical protein
MIGWEHRSIIEIVDARAALPELRRGRRLDELSDVRACAEGALSRARDHDDLDVVVRRQRAEHLVELPPERVVLRVVHLGAVESDGRDLRVDRVQDGLVGLHGFLRTPRVRRSSIAASS